MAIKINADLKKAAQRLLKYFPEIDRRTLSMMLGAYDQWIENETYYGNVIVQIELGIDKPQK